MGGEADLGDKAVAMQKGTRPANPSGTQKTPAPQNHPGRAKSARLGRRPLHRHFPLGWRLVRDAG
jgi:hypothetical protein